MLFKGDVKCPHCKGTGTQQGTYTIPYPCEDCRGVGRLYQCEKCQRLLGASDFEGDAEICMACVDDADLGACPNCGNDAYVAWLQAKTSAYTLTGINCENCGTRTGPSFQAVDALKEWREMQNNGGE